MNFFLAVKTFEASYDPQNFLFNKYELVDLEESNERIQKSSEKISDDENVVLGCLKKAFFLKACVFTPLSNYQFKKSVNFLVLKIFEASYDQTFLFNNYEILDL